jgi:hypothetical protein
MDLERFGEAFINTEAIFDKARAANLTHKHTHACPALTCLRAIELLWTTFRS